MSIDPSIPEAHVPQVPPAAQPAVAQPIPPEPVAPIIESVPEVPPEPVPEPAPEPVPAFWMTRRYFGRSFGFDWHGTFIQGSFHKLDNGQIDCDGLYGTSEFDSTTNLLQQVPAVYIGGLVEKVKSFLS